MEPLEPPSCVQPQVVTVVGGSGFIGGAVIDALLDAGVAEIRNLDFIPGTLSDLRIHHIQGSFRQPAVARAAFAGADSVIHLAATGFVREANANPVLDATENVIGTLQLLDFAAEAEVRRFVYCSSGGTIYGRTAGEEPIVEDTPTHPVNAYGASKLACETYVRLYDSTNSSGLGNRMETLSLRVSNPYGPGQNISRAQGALTTFCHHAVHGKPITIWGDGSVVRDYVQVSDVARAMAVAIVAPAHGTEINIGSGEGISLSGLIELITEIRSQAPSVNYQAARSFDVSRNVLDISRARDLLGWTPQIPLRDGVAQLIAALEAQS